MPVNTKLAEENWQRYVFARDNGHLNYVDKADKCDSFYAGMQWDPATKRKLERQGKPALTINKVLATIGAVEGEQVNNRIEVTYKPAEGGDPDTAHALTKLFKHVAQQNELHWLESYVAADGFITSRGFYDIRVKFTDSMQGVIVITVPNPRHVVIDPDAEHYDPDEWSEIFTTKWMSPDQIAVNYSPEDAKILRNRDTSDFMYGYDSIARPRQSFGLNYGLRQNENGIIDRDIRRNIRVIERQYKKRRLVWRFLDPRTGDISTIPESWSEEYIRYVADQYQLRVLRQNHEQIRWTVTADTVVLHDDWSPYEHFTIVPYFPYFRRGTTIGLVENLISPQEQLNKTSSQELHIVNTTANSGWKVKTQSLVNMSPEELEERGAETGLVIEWQGDDAQAIEKIEPNQVPTGLDRIGFKSDSWIKEISGVSDSLRGQDRADVSGRAIEAKQQRSTINLTKPFDNLRYTHTLLAARVRDLVQAYYTEPRVLRITGSRPTDEPEDVAINQITPEGRIVNDLTVGKYQVMVAMVPPRDIYDDQQFNEATRLRELGVNIPDHWLVEYSHLEDKEQIAREIRAMTGMDSTEEMREAQEAQAQMEAERARAEAEERRAKAYLDTMKAEELAVKIQLERAKLAGDDETTDELRVRLEELAFERDKFQQEMALEQRKARDEAAYRRADLAIKRIQARNQERATSQRRTSNA